MRAAALLIAARLLHRTTRSSNAPLKTSSPPRSPRPGPISIRLIGRADDRFLVLDDEQRVAFVAQIVHHANQPADIARMQTDARFVHDEERVHQRRAETGREIHALHFAAAQRARGAIEREITEPDFAEIIEPRDDFVAQHLRGRVVRRQIQIRARSSRASAIGKQRETPAGSAQSPLQFAPFGAARNDPVIQRLGLKASAVASGQVV